MSDLMTSASPLAMQASFKALLDNCPPDDISPELVTRFILRDGEHQIGRNTGKSIARKWLTMFAAEREACLAEMRMRNPPSSFCFLNEAAEVTEKAFNDMAYLGTSITVTRPNGTVEYIRPEEWGHFGKPGN